jgi:hypothetical protein
MPKDWAAAGFDSSRGTALASNGLSVGAAFRSDRGNAALVGATTTKSGTT